MRNNRPQTKSVWRVIKPPTSRVRPMQRLDAPSSCPRVWAGVSRSSPLNAHSTADTQRGRAKMSCWLHSPLLQKTRTVLPGNALNTLSSYSLERETTLDWAGGMKTFGRAARLFSQCEPMRGPSSPSTPSPPLVETLFSPEVFPIVFARPRFLSPILWTGPLSQVLTIQPTKGTWTRSRQQKTLPPHHSTMEHHLRPHFRHP
jgi:hypothetical protein